MTSEKDNSDLNNAAQNPSHVAAEIASQEPRLLPCPFCASHAHVRNSRIPPDSELRAYWVECVICEVGTKYHATDAQAAETWNTRAESVESLRAENEALKTLAGEDAVGFVATVIEQRETLRARVAELEAFNEKRVEEIMETLIGASDETATEVRAQTWERAIQVAKSKTWFGDKENPEYIMGIVTALEAARDGGKVNG